MDRYLDKSLVGTNHRGLYILLELRRFAGYLLLSYLSPKDHYVLTYLIQHDVFFNVSSLNLPSRPNKQLSSFNEVSRYVDKQPVTSSEITHQFGDRSALKALAL